MRILAYTHAYPGPMRHQAGGETSLHDAMRYLASQGHDCAVLVGEPTPCPSYDIDGVQVRTVQTDREAKAAPMELFPWADVILTQLKCSYRGTLVAQMYGKPVVHYAHNDHKGTLKPLGMSHLGLYNTAWVRKSARSQGTVTPGIVLHPVVEPSRYEVKKTRANRYVTLINLSMGEDGLYDKGWQTFFELAKRNPDIPFLGVEGAYGTQAHIDLPNVEYMPHQTDIREVYRKTKVLLVPSKYESFGRVAVEAAASGIPSICTPTDGLIEAMGDGTTYAPYGLHEDWDCRLSDVLRGYSDSSAKASERSAFLWEQSQQELEDLGFLFEILASAGMREVYEYLDSR